VLPNPTPRMMMPMLAAAAAACVLFAVVAYQAVREPDSGQSADGRP
jgi:hypothetical protein